MWAAHNSPKFFFPPIPFLLICKGPPKQTRFPLQTHSLGVFTHFTTHGGILISRFLFPEGTDTPQHIPAHHLGAISFPFWAPLWGPILGSPQNPLGIWPPFLWGAFPYRAFLYPFYNLRAPFGFIYLGLFPFPFFGTQFTTNFPLLYHFLPFPLFIGSFQSFPFFGPFGGFAPTMGCFWPTFGFTRGRGCPWGSPLAGVSLGVYSFATFFFPSFPLVFRAPTLWGNLFPSQIFFHEEFLSPGSFVFL